MSTKALLCASLLLPLIACSDDSGPNVTPDAGRDLVTADIAHLADSEPGADSAPSDLWLLDSVGGDAGFGACTGACATQTLKIVFGAIEEPMQLAFYGMDRDASGNTGIYLEAYRGAQDACPADGAPTPDQTLILSGLPLPSQGGKVTHDDGLVVSLMDFAGDLLDGGLVTKATSAEVTFSAAQTCPSCVGMTPPSHPEGFVALELTATFAEGTISGHIYARHCDSLDL